MLTDTQLDRYARHIILKDIGGAGQSRLLRSRVLAIGAGGLGSPLLLYLAAAGVGTLGIVDDDAVSLSNLQRQILHTTGAIGRPKTDSATETLGALNPDVAVVGHQTRLTEANAAEIIGQYDLVADGSDNYATRFLVHDTCFRLRKPLVSAAIGQFEGQLATFKGYLGGTHPCYRCFLPETPAAEENCSAAGVLGAVAGVMGTWQAVEVVKELLDLGQGLSGSILLYDALGANVRKIRLRPDPECPLCGEPSAGAAND